MFLHSQVQVSKSEGWSLRSPSKLPCQYELQGQIAREGNLSFFHAGTRVKTTR